MAQQTASFQGVPSIKGFTQSQRMAMLTFSLIGLQCVSILTSTLSTLLD